METLSPQTSPTSSLSPPVTPFSMALPHTYALPPLKTLPTWNRNKFRDEKLVRSIPRNKNIKVELIGRIGKIESYTQTSPPSSSSSDYMGSTKFSVCRKSASSASRSANSANSANKLRKQFDKKIVFLESSHKEVLSHLHRELEKVQGQNKALKFQLVIAGDGVPGIYPSHLISETKADIGQSNNGEESKESQSFLGNCHCEETKSLQREVKEIKKLLHEADIKNIYLTKLIDQLKQRTSASRLHSGQLKTKSIPRNKSDYAMSGTKDIQQRQVSAKMSGKQGKSNSEDREEDYDDTIQGIKGLNIKQQNELFLMDESQLDQDGVNTVLFPKLEQSNNRYAPASANSPGVNRLFKRIQEPISLPALQGLPGNRNMTLRQKRAQALHVQRQRSNRNVSLTVAINKCA